MIEPAALFSKGFMPAGGPVGEMLVIIALWAIGIFGTWTFYRAFRALWRFRP
ncbi:hypothetical protein NRB_06710 [Novosphingobium sp. 11B]